MSGWIRPSRVRLPSGKIPKWIVNAMVVDIPFYTLQKLRELVKEAKYVNASLKNVTE